MNGYETRNALRAEIASMLDHLRDLTDRKADEYSDRAGPNSWIGVADLNLVADKLAEAIGHLGGMTADEARQAAKEISSGN